MIGSSIGTDIGGVQDTVSDFFWNAQTTIYTILKSDSTLMSLTDIYDRVPQDSTFPYMTFFHVISTPYSHKTGNGMDHVFILNIWSRYRGMKEVKQIMERLHTVLHNQDLDIPGLVFARFEFATTRNLGLDKHGIVRLRVRVCK